MQSAKMICVECGARLQPNATQCDLCGAPQSEDSLNELTAQPPQETVVETFSPLSIGRGKQSDLRYCDQCGTENRPEAKFCFMCGAALSQSATVIEAVSPTQPLPKAGTEAVTAAPAFGAMSKQTLLLLGGAILAVVALFGITVWSKSTFKPAAATPPAANAPAANRGNADPAPAAAPLAADLVAKVKPLEEQIKNTADLTKKYELEKQLATLFQENQRNDKAGEVMVEAAKRVNTAEAWSVAGHYWYDWMDVQQDAQQRVDAAQQAIQAYEKSLALKDNPNVRTDLAAAYLTYAIAEAPRKDPNINPMKAIENTNKVLEQNPNHIQANFNKGIMLSVIGRAEQAKAQFEKVKTLAKPGDPAYERAVTMLKELQ